MCKVFLSHNVHSTALILVFFALVYSLHCEATGTGLDCIAIRAVYLFMHQLSLVAYLLRLPVDGWPG